MYSDVVMEVGKKYFEELIDEMKAKKGVTQDVDLTARGLTTSWLSSLRQNTSPRSVPTSPSDPKEQLYGAIMAVFRSWD